MAVAFEGQHWDVAMRSRTSVVADDHGAAAKSSEPFERAQGIDVEVVCGRRAARHWRRIENLGPDGRGLRRRTIRSRLSLWSAPLKLTRGAIAPARVDLRACRAQSVRVAGGNFLPKTLFPCRRDCHAIDRHSPEGTLSTDP